MKSKGKSKKYTTDEDDSIYDCKVSEEGKANSIHFSKNLKHI